jgi:hypothetical protein
VLRRIQRFGLAEAILNIMVDVVNTVSITPTTAGHLIGLCLTPSSLWAVCSRTLFGPCLLRDKLTTGAVPKPGGVVILQGLGRRYLHIWLKNAHLDYRESSTPTQTVRVQQASYCSPTSPNSKRSCAEAEMTCVSYPAPPVRCLHAWSAGQ